MSETAQNLLYILYIEDNLLLQRAISRMLNHTFQVCVVSAKSAAEVMAVMGQYSWAAVISDWNIEGEMTGGDIYDMLRSHYPHLVEKYVFLSSDRMAELLAVAVNVPYLEKPPNPGALQDVISKILGIPLEERG